MLIYFFLIFNSASFLLTPFSKGPNYVAKPENQVLHNTFWTFLGALTQGLLMTSVHLNLMNA